MQAPRLTIERASRLLRSGRLTSQQLCQHAHDLASFGDGPLRLNAHAALRPAGDVIRSASESDERIRAGTGRGPLEGVPVTVKANVAAGGMGGGWEMPHACSAVLEGGLDFDGAPGRRDDNEEGASDPAAYESDVARRLLEECGAVLVGVTNMDEFGMGSLGANNGVSLELDSDGNMKRRRRPPTYNPLPWLEMISGWQGLRQVDRWDDDEISEYLVGRVKSTTADNPHGMLDDSLAMLLEEVEYWHSNDSLERHGRRPGSTESPLISPGGSSSGAAVTVSHGSSLLSIGTDTGGSLRLPSAWTSTVGFKPTYGSISRYGVVSYASSLDTVGYITPTAECARIAWDCLRPDRDRGGVSDERPKRWRPGSSRDATSRIYHVGMSKHRENGKDNSDFAYKVGIPSAFSIEELPPKIGEAWSATAKRLEERGATIVSIPESRLPSEWIKLSLAAYYVLACAEASSNLSRYDGVGYGLGLDPEQYADEDSDMTPLEQRISATRALGFGDEVQRRVLTGTSVLSSDRFHTHYEAAATVRARVSQSMECVLESADDRVDALLVPTSVSFPPTLYPGSNGRGVEVDATLAFANDLMTVPISLGGFPSVSVPAHHEAGESREPIGMQLVGGRGAEEALLKLAEILL